MKEVSKLNSHIPYLDTSEPEAIIGILRNGKIIKEVTWLAHRELSATLSGKYLGLLRSTKLRKEDLGGVAVFVGPGSFTGLRIGLSFANGLAFGLKIPVFETKKRGQVNLKNPKQIAVPFYGAPPKTTKPKKK